MPTLQQTTHEQNLQMIEQLRSQQEVDRSLIAVLGVSLQELEKREKTVHRALASTSESVWGAASARRATTKTLDKIARQSTALSSRIENAKYRIEVAAKRIAGFAG